MMKKILQKVWIVLSEKEEWLHDPGHSGAHIKQILRIFIKSSIREKINYFSLQIALTFPVREKS